MKRFIFPILTLLCALSLTACTSQPSPSAEEPPPPPTNSDCAHLISGGFCLKCGKDCGFWYHCDILDDNGEKTGEWAISSLDRVLGTYSNQEISDGIMTAQLWCGRHGIFSIALWDEDGNPVEPTVGHDRYTINIQTETYTSFGPEGWMYVGSNQIIVEEYRKMDFLQALCGHGEITFLLQNQDEPDRTYTFTVYASNFQALYEELMGRPVEFR